MTPAECMKSRATACDAISLSGLTGSMEYVRDAGAHPHSPYTPVLLSQALMGTPARMSTLATVYRHGIQNQCRANPRFIGGQTTLLTALHVLQGDLLLWAVCAQRVSRSFGSRCFHGACSFTTPRMVTQWDVGCGTLTISCTTYEAMRRNLVCNYATRKNY